MRLGILADIHEQIEFLRLALERFRRESVDRVVVLGDVAETGDSLEETCSLLAEADAVGVWGNHDFGLCQPAGTPVRKKYSPDVLRFMRTLRPRLEIDGCLFTHVEPWLDTRDLKQLWHFDGPPNTLDKVARSFEAIPNRIMFTGHFHRWMIATQNRITDWTGDSPVKLDADFRYLILISALCDGRYATFDTDTLELVAFDESR